MNKIKRMKTVLVSMIITVFMVLSYVDVFAASFSIRASASSVTPGGSFTVTVSAPGAGQFSFSASNGTVSASSGWVDGSYSLKVTAGQSGTTTVTATAVDATGNDETPITGSKSVSVSIKQPSSGTGGNNTSSGGNTSSSGGNTSSGTTDNRSKENNLSSLSVSTGTLSPEFSASTTTYKVELTSDVNKITVSAKAKDSKATVSGAGEHELKVGENNITVTVVAQNGAKKVYTISVYVTEKPTTFLKLGDQNLGVLSDLSKVDVPKGFEPTKVTVDGKEVIALKSETFGLTLLYLQNDKQEVGFYIFEDGNVTSKFQTISVNGKNFVVISAPKDLSGTNDLKSGTIKIGDVELQGWTYSDKNKANFSIVYLMNDAGEKSLYSYESTEGTLQKYAPNETSSNHTLTYVFIGTTVLFAAGCGTLGYLYMTFKKKSISAIKDYYDSKNQSE